MGTGVKAGAKDSSLSVSLPSFSFFILLPFLFLSVAIVNVFIVAATFYVFYTVLPPCFYYVCLFLSFMHGSLPGGKC